MGIITVKREPYEAGKLSPMKIFIDGEEKIEIDSDESVNIAVSDGPHIIHAKFGEDSNKLSVTSGSSPIHVTATVSLIPNKSAVTVKLSE